MGPSRKRPRTNAPSNQSTKTAADELKNIAVQTPLPETPSNGSSVNPLEGSSSTPRKTSKASDNEKSSSKASWYGTWPRKSAASTSIARENVTVDKTISTSPTNTSHPEQSKPPTSLYRPPLMSVGKAKETTNITMAGATEFGSSSKVKDSSSIQSKASLASPSKAAVPTVDVSKELSSSQMGDLPRDGQKEEQMQSTISDRPSTSSGWLGSWLGRPVVQPPLTKTQLDRAGQTAEQKVMSLQNSPQSSTDLQDRDQDKSNEVVTQKESHIKFKEGPKILVDTKVMQQTSQNSKKDTSATPTALKAVNEQSATATTIPQPSSSWFSLWSRAGPDSKTKEAEAPQVPIVMSQPNEDTVMEDVCQTEANKPAPGSSWAFWTSEATPASGVTVKPAETQGELAVAGKPSESKPEAAKTLEPKNAKAAKPKTKESRKILLANTIPQSKTQADDASIKSVASKNANAVKTIPPNLLIPSVKDTYRMLENPSILQQLARLLLKGKQPPTKHLFLVKDPPKIKHALAIGIHGLFPAPLLRTVIGQPTGTSIKFANHAAESIRRWTDKHGFMDCEIERVALEGEGKIDDRVDNLWKLLLNWIEHVRKADFILLGCHSQGVPVAVMLVAKLIEFGVVSVAKIGICAMAGVSLGPFADYKSRLFSGSAGELFDFADPESSVSKRYEEALRVVLKYGAKITYCGSIDDQLVSMESSIFATVNHPHIFRVVFVDGRIHAPDFLAHLVGFALKLRNLGVSDHGLIRELSAPLAGSLYTGEGHSRLYDDGKVYDLATEFALETTSVSEIPLQVTKYEIPTNANPYVLPWIMRGLLEEDFVKTELDAETTELLKQFDDWKPSTKVLKDVKYRLEAVKSKL